MAIISPRALKGTVVLKFAFGAFTALMLAGCSDSIERFSENYSNPSDQDPVYTASVKHYHKKITKFHAPAAAVAEPQDQVVETPIAPVQSFKPKAPSIDYSSSYKQAYQQPQITKPALQAPQMVAEAPQVPEAPAYQPPVYKAPKFQAPTYKKPRLVVDQAVASNEPAATNYDNPAPVKQIAAAPKLKVPEPVAEPQVADASPNKIKMKPGMTLYGIARAHHMTVQQLAAANHIKPPYVVPPGRDLIIPNGAGVAVAAVEDQQAPEPAPKMKKVDLAKAAPVAKSPAVAKDNSDQIADTDASPAAAPVTMAKKPAPLTLPKEPDAKVATTETPVDSNPQLALRWPLHGKVISGFGPKSNGLKNEGINIAVPEGTNIQAADAGVVAYAGNELKGYGNLILIRHEGGYVTAYAHASKLLVKKGDTVKRGAIIAVAGQTGAVQSPQLHFEVRKGATALDPQKFLSSSTAMN